MFCKHESTCDEHAGWTLACINNCYELGAKQHLVHLCLYYACTKGSGERFTWETKGLYVSQQGTCTY